MAQITLNSTGVASNGALVLQSNGTTTAVTVDTAQNVGIGVTPPTSTDAGNITIKGGSTLNFSTASGNMAANATFNSGWKYIATAAAVKYTQSGAEHQWFTAASGTAGNAITFTQAMTLDANAKLSTNAAQSGDSGASSATRTLLQQQTSGTQATAGVFTVYGIIHPSVYNVTLDSSTGSGAAAPMLFATGNTERARITSGGDLLVGQSSTTVPGSGNTTAGSAIQSGGRAYFSASTERAFSLNRNEDGSVAGFNRSGTLVGSISVTTTATAYNTSSDQRLKENIQNADSASSLIDALQVRQFDWKSDNSHQRYGFIAQELVTVAPEAVHQPSDAEEMMAVDYSKLVPMLVKEIQSLRTRIAQLESKL